VNVPARYWGLALIVGVLSACGSTATANAPTAPVTTATVATAAPTEGPASAVPTPAPTQAASTPAPTAAPATAGQISVPNGVGLNYQAAQDLWRAAGLHVFPAMDATGANRLPIIDSNWVVLSQDLKAGSFVDSGSFIRATVKKYTDS
jgi:hypothetical protein